MTERSRRMLAELDPAAQPKFEFFLGLIDGELGDTRYIVYEGRRMKIKQEAYHAQGRRPLEEVNSLRQLAGLAPLRSEKDNFEITWTLESKHIDGLAMDIVPVDSSGNPTWDLGHFWNAYEIIRNCGRKAGLVCGADWKRPDWPHFELK